MSTLLLNFRALGGAMHHASAQLAVSTNVKGRPAKSAKQKAKSESEEAKELDRALVDRARSGDHDAFRQLVERYQSRAHAIALGILGNYEDAEEIAQEAFVKAYRNLHSFRGQSSFYTWLYRIIFNLSIDLSRKAYRRSEIGLEDSSALDSVAQSSETDAGAYMATVAGPDEELFRSEIRSRFSEALKKLSPEHRTVIMLREIDGLSYAEISDVVGCSKGTVMSRLHHARKRLQASLAELSPQEETSGSAGDDASTVQNRAAKSVQMHDVNQEERQS